MNIEIKREKKIRVRESRVAYNVLREIYLRESKIEREQEHLWVVSLTAQNDIISIDLVSLGSINKTVVEPMQVYRMALIKGASAIYLAHNHPSLNIFPTEGDIKITDKMIQVGKILDIKLVDHLIISEKDYYSFSDNQLIQKMEVCSDFPIPYQEKAKIKKEGHKLGLKEGKKAGLIKGMERKALNIAKRMKKKDESIKKILEYTGLSKKELEKII
jgi:DNA repair protein RadC